MAEKSLLLLLAVCFVPAIVAARVMSDSFLVSGLVYCDTCRCGYETHASTYMPGATVRIECRDRDTGRITYTSRDGVTDSAGKYIIEVKSDHGDDYCDAYLVKSSNPECSVPNAGRDRSRVTLTGNNGIASNVREANSLGFMAEKPLADCGQILMKYQEED